MKPFVIFDMDGTLADASAREHHLRKTPQDWDSFFADCHQDSVIDPIAGLYRALCASPDYEIAIFTGRPDRIRKMTEDWMVKHHLPLRPIHCRKDGDDRHDLVIKKEIYTDFISNGNHIAFIIEDRNSVVKMWRDMGVVCLHCFDADF